MDHDEFLTLWREPLLFEVEIVDVASACRAAHRKGEKFTFSWNTPEGMCGEAFVGMYPVLFSLQVGGDMTLLGSEDNNVRVYTCPSRVVQFKITASEQCPFCGSREGLEKCEILVGDTPHGFKVCPQCRITYSRNT
jgi:uncharacterized repeat protein (TIGR04076 family)